MISRRTHPRPQHSIARWLRVSATLAAFVLAMAVTAPAASAEPGDHRGPTGRARAVLLQATRAMGGADALANLDRFEIEATGASRIRFEIEQPDELIDTSTYERTYTFDLADELLRVETTRQPLFEGFQFLPPQSFSRVAHGDVGGVTDGAGFLAPAGTLPSESVAAMHKQQRLFNPQLVLRDAIEQPDLVGYGGSIRLDGRRHRILTIADEVAEIRLFVDQRTGLISKLETTENNPLVRDSKIEVHYDDWRRQGSGRGGGRHRGLAIPYDVEQYADGALIWEETRVSIDLDPTLPADHFDLPPGTDPTAVDADGLAFGAQSQHLVEGFFALGFFYAANSPLGPPVELAPGVTLLPSGANSLVVEYDGGALVLEAPNTPAHGTDIVDAVNGLVPGAPITHIIQSHHHVDHASGVRSLVAAGATVVVGNGVGEFWEDVLTAPSTVRPDALANSGAAGDVVELDFGGTYTISDDDVTVTAHHLTNGLHAVDNLVVMIDTGGERFVFGADLFNAGINFSLVIGGPEAFFAELRNLDIIDDSCASDIPLTIVPAHGIPQSLEASIIELDGLGIDVGC